MIAFLIFADVAVAAVGVTSVDVQCHESSLNGPEHAVLTIARRGGVYSDGKRAYPGAAVAELAAAVQEEAPALDPALLLPDAALLRLSVDRWAQARSAKAALKKALMASLQQPAALEAAVRAYYASRWTDDYPLCRIELIFDGNRRLGATSKAQQAFMIPWQVGGTQSYSPRIGRALAALLPAGFLQKERLGGGLLADRVVEELARLNLR